MKRLLFILLNIVPLIVLANDYYWYNGTKIHLQQGNKWYRLYKDDNNHDTETQNVVNGRSSQSTSLIWETSDSKTEYDTQNIVYQTPSFLCFDGTQDMYVTHRFYVKLKHAEDVVLLQNLADQYHVSLEEDANLPLWYIISCSANSQYNALELANIFYETNLFAASEPEFLGALQLDCVNDAMFNEQWNLKNTGQYGSAYSGVDINYCGARNITKGAPSVIVGVYDLGVDLTHPDLTLHTFSYDAYTESSPSQLYASDGNIYHGTACAGIIGAKTNNSIGVAGIAPNCPIMSLSINPSSTTSAQIKNGYIIAADNGCHVISNSWSRGTPSSLVDEGISYALSHGRNGKGCVIVFSAGNDNRDRANYPANSNDSIIVVGAISPCGERKDFTSCDGEWWGSNYGNSIDVVAPGVKIRTTDNVGTAGKNSTNYMNNFNGTSSACPHVASVAALVLSVNPFLTQKEVADIIESTAQKVGDYSYSQKDTRPNGTWNNEVGYGLVDAYAAVLAAKNMAPHIIGEATLSSQSTYSVTNLPAGAKIKWTYTFTQNETNANHVSGNAISFVNGDSTASVVIKRELYQHVEPTSPDPETGEVTIPRPELRYFAGTLVLKATINDGVYVITKTITLPDSGPLLPVNPDLPIIPLSETDTNTDVTPLDMEEENINVFSSNSTQYQLRYTNPISVDNSVVHIDKLSEAGDDYIPYNGNYVLEIWHDQLGLIKRIEDSTSYLNLDCGDIPMGIYQMILIVNEQIVVQSKLLKL